MTVTGEEADRKALRQHGDKVVVEALTVARRATPTEAEGGVSTRVTRGERRGTSDRDK